MYRRRRYAWLGNGNITTEHSDHSENDGLLSGRMMLSAAVFIRRSEDNGSEHDAIRTMRGIVETVHELSPDLRITRIPLIFLSREGIDSSAYCDPGDDQDRQPGGLDLRTVFSSARTGRILI